MGRCESERPPEPHSCFQRRVPQPTFAKQPPTGLLVLLCQRCEALPQCMLLGLEVCHRRWQVAGGGLSLTYISFRTSMGGCWARVANWGWLAPQGEGGPSCT